MIANNLLGLREGTDSGGRNSLRLASLPLGAIEAILL